MLTMYQPSSGLLYMASLHRCAEKGRISARQTWKIIRPDSPHLNGNWFTYFIDMICPTTCGITITSGKVNSGLFVGNMSWKKVMLVNRI